MDQDFPVRAAAARDFQVPAERVFDAWLDPAQLGQWMFGPKIRDEEVVDLTLDPRVGGQFRFAVRRQGQLMTHVGEYLEIVRPTRLAFTWGIEGDQDSSRVEIDIVEQGEACQLKLVHFMRPAWAALAEKGHLAWMQILKVLGSSL